MENIQFNKKLALYGIIASLLVILIILVLFINMNRKKNTTTDSTSPTGQLHASPTTFFPDTNTTIIPERKTGAIDDDIPKIELDKSAQKTDLIKKTPLKLEVATVTFDFAEDQFFVILVEPKTTSRTRFESWLKENYPAIPVTEFQFE